MDMKTRKPSVAGYFYPADREALSKLIQGFLSRKATGEKYISAICPHAGYLFSGTTAGMVYNTIDIPETVIILGPNHTGYGEPYAVSDTDAWETPLGNIKTDQAVINDLVSNSQYLERDNIAHEKEHSLEVQIPFIQFLNPSAGIVPITLAGYVDNPAWIEIGESIAHAIQKSSEKDMLIIASSDMSHYEPQDTAEEKDRYAIESILSLDENLLIERIAEKNISMCGYGPVISTLVASRILGAQEGKLIEYTTSGQKNQDYSQVVGYAGIVIR